MAKCDIHALRELYLYFVQVIFATLWQVGVKKYTVLLYGVFLYPSDALLSQAAARQVSSAPQSLTTVFGMGTGVSSALLSLSTSKYDTSHISLFDKLSNPFLDKPSAY